MADASVRDYAYYQHRRELKEQRAVQDLRKGVLHRQFDLQAQDQRMKYERPSFAVVTASEAFRAGYDQIEWKPKGDTDNGLDSPAVSRQEHS